MICGNCAGSGNCRSCNGTGQQGRKDCGACNGSGTCPNCTGTGKIEDTDY